MSLTPGLRYTLSRAVTPAMTAAAVGSGELPVLATPMLAALLEETCWKCVAPHLAPGETTVGTSLTLTHEAPTPVGGLFTCAAELTEVDRRRLTFTCLLSDETGPIAHATHERFLVDAARFAEKAASRLSNNRKDTPAT
ncbi:MAG: thioesterase family protein [bacterium]